MILLNTRSIISGCGSYLPKKIVSNADLVEKVDTTDEWIVARTGIRQRHIAADTENTSDLACEAAKRAIENAGINPSAIDIIIYGQSVGDNFIRAKQATTVLVIGAETFSRILDWSDRGTCVLFGDGAGAVILQKSDTKQLQNKIYQNNKDLCRGILSTHLYSDGSTNDLLYVEGGPSSTQTVGHVRMIGKEVFRHAVNNLSSVVLETLQNNKIKAEEIDWLVPHQANKRILDSTAKKLNIPNKRVVITIDRHANTSAASIPLALDEAVRDGRIKYGDLILMEAMGGGLTWGAALVRW